MAAAHNLGGLRPHPPGRCPGPRPSSEMPPRVTTGAAAGGYLLAGRVTGAAEPPPRSRAPPASQAMTLRVTLDQPGEPAAQTWVPDEEIPKPPGGLPGRAEPGNQAGRWTAQLDRCSIKQKRKMIRPAVPSGGGTVEDNSHPDQRIWGESSLHQTRGAPSCLVHPSDGGARGEVQGVGEDCGGQLGGEVDEGGPASGHGSDAKGAQALAEPGRGAGTIWLELNAKGPHGISLCFLQDLIQGRGTGHWRSVAVGRRDLLTRSPRLRR